MKKHILNKLKGLDAKVAIRLVEKYGHESEIVLEGEVITQQARPNTVILWTKDDVVVQATAGDPTELE
jgi:hypothetical protein